jgi:hypothetical protein
MYVESQVACLEWAADEQPLRGETTMTVQARAVTRNYDVFAGLDVDKKSLAVIFTDHEQSMQSLRLPYSAEQQQLRHVRKCFPEQREAFVESTKCAQGRDPERYGAATRNTRERTPSRTNGFTNRLA